MDFFKVVLVGIFAIGILCTPFILAKKKGVNKGNAARSIKLNLGAFAVVAILCLSFPLISYAASPAETTNTEDSVVTVETTSEAETTNSSAGLAYIAAALSTGIACLGAGIAVGGAAPAAIGAVTEDPKSFGKSIIFVVLGEGVAIYGMLISIMILNTI